MRFPNCFMLVHLIFRRIGAVYLSVAYNDNIAHNRKKNILQCVKRAAAGFHPWCCRCDLIVRR